MNKIKSIYVCENAFLSEGSKNLNLIGIFERITVSSFPRNFPVFFLTVHIQFEEEKEHNVEIKVIANGVMQEEIFQYNVDGKKVQIIHKFINYKFESAGDYEFQIIADGENLGSTTINLQKKND
jgi:hypothetical protein